MAVHWTKNKRKLYASYSLSARRAALNIDAAARSENRQPHNMDNCGSCRTVHNQSASCAIPDAPMYVCSNDTFMSGWGYAKGMINVCVVPVANQAEARAVVSYMESRSDQNRIRIVYSKPQARGRKMSLLLQWRYNALGLNEPR